MNNVLPSLHGKDRFRRNNIMREDIKLAVSMSGNSDTLGNTERATEAFNAFVTKLIDPERFRIIAEKYNQIV